MIKTSSLCLFFAFSAAGSARAADWPTWGFDGSRNMVSADKGLPATFNPGKRFADREDIDPATTQGVRWTAKLGSQTYGNPTVSGGRVFVGTNNEVPRDPRHKGDRSVLMAFDEKTGAFLWQLVVPKLGSGKVNDWELLGITSSPTVEGDRVFLVTNRGEVLCLDAKGLADGNEGPFVDEAQYSVGPGAAPIAPGDKDADIVWRYDLREELGVFPHNATSSSILVVGDRLYVTTSNGVDWSHINIPSPNAPSLVALDKKTGALLGEESVGVSSRTLHSNWSSPTLASSTIPGKAPRPMVVFGAGDGWTYAFGPAPALDKEGLSVLPELWRYDVNPPGYRNGRNGKPIKYPLPDGPSEVLATPVFAGGRLFVAIGQDPEHGSGRGQITCIDPSGTGDVTKKKRVWSYDKIGRSISTPAVAGGIVYTADFDGRVYAFDEKKGKLLWSHDSRAHIWGSPLAADDKVYLGTEDGTLLVFAQGKAKKLLGEVEVGAPIYSSPIVASGVLYVASQTHLFAIGGAAAAPVGSPAK